uniref:Uncharacterized protein n=1 Tax=Acanthochromis polyacanthus TaxID=80966 RepID=A0A3Q1HQ65_9TELE
MAEDHGLGDGDGSVDVTESLELLLLAVAQHIVLFDGIERLLFSLQLDDVGIWHNALKQQHLAVFRKHPGQQRGQGSKVSKLKNHEHFHLLGVYELEFTTPVQHGTRCPNNYLGTDLNRNCGFIFKNSNNNLDFHSMLNNLPVW